MDSAAPEASLPAPGIVRRLAAMLYELLLVLGVLFFFFLIPNAALGAIAHIVLPGPLLLAYAILAIAAYFLWFWRRHGRTLAMQTWNIRLRSAHGGAATLAQLLLRFVLAWPSTLCCGVGILWALFDRDRQFLHDRLAGTRQELVA